MFNHTHLPRAEVDGNQADFADERPHDAIVSPARFSRLALCVTAATALTLGVVGTVAYGVWFNHDQQAYADAIANARQSVGTPAVSSVPAGHAVVATTGYSTGLATTASAGVTTRVVAQAATEAVDASNSDAQSPEDQQQEAGSSHAIWSGQVAQAPAPGVAAAGGAGDGLAVPAAPAVATSPVPALHSNRHATGSSDSSAPQGASSRSAKDNRAALQERRIAADNARNSRQNARHQDNLFARMGQFFRSVSYRQHGGANPQQQDLYSHP